MNYIYFRIQFQFQCQSAAFLFLPCTRRTLMLWHCLVFTAFCRNVRIPTLFSSPVESLACKIIEWCRQSSNENGVNSYCEMAKTNKIIIAHMTAMKNDEHRNNNNNSNRKLPILFFHRVYCDYLFMRHSKVNA